jgi:hypothetical protein
MAKRKRKKTAEERKSALLDGLVEARSRILEEAVGIDEQLQDEVFLGEWSLKDLLAHLAGWDVTNGQAAQEILRGELPAFYAHRDKDWASYNAKLIAEYHRDDFEDLIELLKQTHRQMIEILEQIPAGEYEKDRGIRARGYIVLISRLLQTELDDEKQHLDEIRTFVASK